MKFAVSINSKKYLLSADQIETLAAVLQDAEYLYEKWVGENKGSHGSDKQYNYQLLRADPASIATLEAVSDDFIDTIRLSQKLNANI